MSFHRGDLPGAIAVSYNTNTMASLSPSRRYSSGSSSTTTSTIGSAANPTKYLTHRSSGNMDRINHSTTTSSYRLLPRRAHFSPARSVSLYSDIGSVSSTTINFLPKYSSASTSSASSTTSSSASSNARERNESCTWPDDMHTKYSPSTYTPNIHGSRSSLSTSSSSSILNGHSRSAFSASSSIIGLAELHGGDERENTFHDKWSNRQIKRRNNPINTVLTSHDQIDSVAAPNEVKEQQKPQHEENIVRNNINRVTDNHNNNGNNNDCDLEDVNVVRINNHNDNIDIDDDNQNHHNHHNSMLADGMQKVPTTSCFTSFLPTYSTTSVSPSSISPNHSTSQPLISTIAPNISTASISTITTITTTTTTTTTTTVINTTTTATTTTTTFTATTTTTTPTTATTTRTSATSSTVVSVGASTIDCTVYSWIKTPANTNNTNLPTNNNDPSCNDFGVAKRTDNNKKSSSIVDTTQWEIDNEDVNRQLNRRDISVQANNVLLIVNDCVCESDISIDNIHSTTYPGSNSENDMKAENNGLLDENIRLTSKPTDNHGNDSSKPSTSRRTTVFDWNDSFNGDSSNASTSNNTSNVPVGVHQTIYREINNQTEESSTSRLPRNRTQSRRDEGYGLNGLRNIGNTCFMNSVIQCMSNTRPLLEYLVNEQHLNDINTTTSSMKGALIKAFAQVIHELWESSGERVVNTASLKSQIQRFAPRFIGYAQQDAQEFLRYLLEGLHEDVNRVAIKPQPILTDIPDHYSDSQKAAESWKRYLLSEDSTVVDVFVGQLRSSLTCTSCDHVSVTLDPFWDLSLPIPARSGTVRLNQCLEHFTKVETLDGDEKPICSKCQMRTKCTKSFSIQKFPKILVIHLKRFSPTERFRAKLSVLVDFPLMGLDLSAFAAPGVRGCTYNLYGVANHSGTPYSGHYTAYCKHPYSSEWHEYNDNRVSSVSPNSVISSEAYVLFYEQQPLSHHL